MLCISMATQQVCIGSWHAFQVPIGTITSVSKPPTTTAFNDLNLAKDAPEGILPQFNSGAVSDFYGLPSNSTCIYRTGNEWPVPQGPEAQQVPREVQPVFNHHLQDVWPALHIKVYEFLDSARALWTTIDPVYFAKEGRKETSPVYLWIGVILYLGLCPLRMPRLWLLAARTS